MFSGQFSIVRWKLNQNITYIYIYIYIYIYNNDGHSY